MPQVAEIFSAGFELDPANGGDWAARRIHERLLEAKEPVRTGRQRPFAGLQTRVNQHHR